MWVGFRQRNDIPPQTAPRINPVAIRWMPDGKNHRLVSEYARMELGESPAARNRADGLARYDHFGVRRRTGATT